MSHVTYVRYEVLRTMRNLRFFAFSLAFPVILFLVVAGANRSEQDFAGMGVSFALYYMVGMVAWGAMAAVIAGGGRIAQERSVGWVRQLRITPLTVRSYFTAKVLSGYCTAAISILVLYGAGIVYGVRLPWDDWLRMTALILVALIPFAAMGIWLGHVLSVDSLAPAMGGLTALLALFGGAWGPITGTTGSLHDLSRLLPSYWLVQAGPYALSGELWPAKGWAVVAAWTLVMIALSRRAYRRDSLRV